MPGKNSARGHPRAAVLFIITLLSLTLLSASVARAQVFHYTNNTAAQFDDDQGDAYLITPMGQLATFLYPIGVILKSALRTESLLVSGAYHLPREKRAKYLHPDFPRRDDGTSFLYQDLADMVKGKNPR